MTFVHSGHLSLASNDFGTVRFLWNKTLILSLVKEKSSSGFRDFSLSKGRLGSEVISGVQLVVFEFTQAMSSSSEREVSVGVGRRCGRRSNRNFMVCQLWFLSVTVVK